MQYKKLAKLYDGFTSDKTHAEWTRYIIDLFKKYDIKIANKVLDVCCGTGGKTLELYKKGYNVTGLDISSDMLEVAASKFANSGAKIQLICQDICNINLHRKQNAVICINDGINYIINIANLIKAFTNIREVLEKDGVFLFDISSEYKLKSVHDKSYFEETEASAYIWHNEYEESKKLLTMDISLYAQLEDDLYEKSNEIHIQRAYSINEIIGCLKEAGFNNFEYYECFTFIKPNEKSHRIQFVAKV